MRVLDIIGIVAIFGVVLWIGWRATKKTKTSDDFLMANKSLSKIQAGFSMAASDMGGNAVLGAVGYAYVIGLAGVWYNWGAVIPMLLLAFVLAKPLRRMAVDSVPELLGRRYNTATRVIAVAAHILAICATLGIQFTVAATAISSITGISFNLALLISVVIVIAYTMGGGLLAVVNTDVFQFVIICASVLLAIPFALNSAGGWSQVAASVPEGFLNIGNDGILMPISLGLLYAFDYATNQHILQRVFAAKDSSTAKFAFAFSGVTYIFFGIVVALIGVIASVLYPNVESTNTVYAMLVRDVLPAGVAGIALGGIFAASMSTADSKIMSISQLFVNDIYKPFISKGKEISDQHVLKISRWVTLVISVLGVGVSLVSDSLIQMMYVGGLFYGTAVFVPMFLAIYWKRGTASAALASIIAAMGVGLYSEYFLAGQVGGFFGMPSNLLAALVGLVVFVVVSLATKPPSEEQLAVVNNI